MNEVDEVSMNCFDRVEFVYIDRGIREMDECESS